MDSSDNYEIKYKISKNQMTCLTVSYRLKNILRSVFILYEIQKCINYIILYDGTKRSFFMAHRSFFFVFCSVQYWKKVGPPRL